jgi:DNA-binding transcriptional ArsR family regulator
VIKNKLFDGDRMNKTYSIKIEYSPVYECIASFYAYINRKEGKNLYLDNDWRDETARRLPPSFAAELADERWEVLHRIVLLAAQSPAKTSVEQFLDWLGAIPAGEIYERLAPWVSVIPLNLGEIRDRSLSLLSRWHEHYFAALEPQILDRLAASARRFARMAEQMEPPELVEEATNGIRIEPTDHLQQVVLAPQYHCAPTTILDFYRGIATCLYPVADAAAGPDPLRELLPLAQCLADEKRLQILRCLAEKPCTLGELQQQVSLAKSTVHHHISTLRRAGMIRAHFADSTTAIGYSLRERFLDRLPELIRTFLSSGGNGR